MAKNFTVSFILFSLLVSAAICIAPVSALYNIDVTSEPSGAAVFFEFIKGSRSYPEFVGFTPVDTWRETAPGEAAVWVFMEGYQPFSQPLAEHSRDAIHAILLPGNGDSGDPGYIFVRSEQFDQWDENTLSWHSGCEVSVDFEDTGQTPLLLEDDPATYVITCSKEGYVDFVDIVEIEAGEVVFVNAEGMEQPGETVGTLSVTSTPGGASVYIDGAYEGTTPCTIPDVDACQHLIQFQLAGYESHAENVRVTAEETTSMDVILEPVAAQPAGDGETALSVTSSPSGAGVYENGVHIGATPFTVTGVEPGSRTIVVALDGYLDYSTTISIEEGQTGTVHADLVPEGQVQPVQTTVSATAAPAAAGQDTGTLTVTSNPSAAGVYENGVLIGATPLTVTGVDTGPRTITFALDGYADYVTTANVGVGQTATVHAELEPHQQAVSGEQPTTGSITVSSIPGGATATINNRYARTTPASYPAVP
ncbi:MAG: hypothetical protein APR55_03475, partial [Methanolinea sp. SDB]